MAEAAGAEVIFEWDCNIAQSWVPTEPIPSDMVTWAYSLGITKYDNTTSFMYDYSVTREQAAKMIMTAIQASWVQPWMKQQVWSCEWSDADQIDISLINEVDASCDKWLFHGFNGNFMPKAYLTDTDARTVIFRVAEYIPALSDILATVRLAAPQNKVLTRGEFLQWLYQLYQQINPIVVLDSPVLPAIPLVDGDYSLSSYNGSSILASTDITMSLSGGVVSARICNIINGSYAIDHDNTINFISFDELMSTEMACADDQITTIEDQFNTTTNAEIDISIDNQLIIYLPSGSIMIWTK